MQRSPTVIKTAFNICSTLNGIVEQTHVIYIFRKREKEKKRKREKRNEPQIVLKNTGTVARLVLYRDCLDLFESCDAVKTI